MYQGWFVVISRLPGAGFGQSELFPDWISCLWTDWVPGKLEFSEKGGSTVQVGPGHLLDEVG